jgi:hypothetical protein
VEIETTKTIQRFNETKSCFFEKITRSMPLSQQSKTEEGKTQINKIKDEKGDITTNNKLLRIVSEYLQNLYSSKLENPDEMDKFLDAYSQPKLYQEDINYLKRTTTINVIEALITSLYIKREQHLMYSWPNFTKPVKKRTENNTPQILPGNRKGRNTSKFIL